MQSTHRSPKGKGRAVDEDYAQSLASLSLSDCGDLAPYRNSYGSSYADAYGSSYEQPYTSDGQYSWTMQSPLAPMQSSSAVYGGTPGYGSTPGYGNSYLPTSALSSIGGHDNQGEPDRSTYSLHTGNNAVSVTSSSAPSSYGGASVSGWSETRSNGTGRESVDRDDDQDDDRSDVNNTIHRQRPPNERYQLPCELYNLTGCKRVFPGDEVQDWIDHIEGHLQSKFPIKLRCWFCNEHFFNARETSNGDVRSNFNMRMHHIRHHIVYEGYRPEQMQKDGYLVTHLLDRNLIDRRTYESILTPKLPIPGSQGRHSSHRSDRSNHSHRRLPQVEDETVVAEFSSRHHHRYEAQIPGFRSFRDVHTHRSTRARRNREGISEIGFPPVVIQPDPPVRRPRRPSSSMSPSSKLLENISLEGSSISSRNTARKYYENQSVGRAGDGTAANTVVSQLHKLDTGLLGKRSGDTPSRVESPRPHDHSDDGPSSCPTDTSTHESDPFWLPEYSEDEDKKLDENHLFIQFRGVAVERLFEAFRSWKGDHSEEDLPCDGEGESDFASKQDKGKGKASAPGKRALADQSESSNTIAGGSGPSSNRVGCSKRRRMSGRQLTFACPYTKKDPMSYRHCYKYKLSRIRDVKQHLARCHRNPPYCPRCMSTFETEEERDEHIREFSCPLQPPVRLDGVTESQRSQLAKKSAPNATPEAQWFAVFDIVFPGHKPRPLSPYIDSELLQDITHYQDFLTSHGPRIISGFLAQQGVVTWHLPNEDHDLAAFQQTILEEGLGIVFEQWLARRSSSSQNSNLLSGSGSFGQNTPPSSSNSREGVGPNADHDSGAVPSVIAESPPDGRSLDALPGGMDIPDNSANHFSFDEGLDETFDFEHGGVEFPAGQTYDVDDMTRLMMDDAEASSSFQLGWTEVTDQRPEHWRTEHRRTEHRRTPSANRSPHKQRHRR